MTHGFLRRFSESRLGAFVTAEAKILILIAATGLLVYGFIRVAGEVTSGDTHAVDNAILMWFRVDGDPGRMIGSFWFHETVRDFTALGGGPILTLIVVLVATFLVLVRQIGTAALVVVATASGGLVSDGLKIVFGRPRPEFSSVAQELSASFPSGHAMLSAVTFLTIGALLARMTPYWRLRIYYLVTAIALTVLVGITRVILGVHYPSDVVAGWALGAAWALGWSTLALLVQRRQSNRPPK